MTMLFADGFDVYANLTDMARAGWWCDVDTFTVATTGGRFSGGAFQNNTASGNYASVPITAATGRTLYICGWFKHGGTGGATDVIIKGWGTSRTGNGIFTLRINTSGDVTLLAGATSVATASAAIPSGSYAWLELKVVLGTTTSNGLIELRVNEAVVATSTSTINTNAAVGLVSFGGSAGASPGFWDDIVILDDTGSSPNNNYPGAIRIDTLAANAAGSENNWSNSYTAVDDTPNATDDDSTYVAATTASTKSNYSCADLIVDPNVKFAVQVRAKMKKADVGSKTARTYVRVTSSETTGPTKAMSTDYGWISSGPIVADPSTSSAWTLSGIQNALAGIEVVS